MGGRMTNFPGVCLEATAASGGVLDRTNSDQALFAPSPLSNPPMSHYSEGRGGKHITGVAVQYFAAPRMETEGLL